MLHALHRDGVLLVPLYHGTSTAFGSSIARHGLGATSPVADLKVIDFLNSIAPACRNYLHDDPEWPLIEGALDRMLSQTVTRAGINFRHGSHAYLTPSQYAAAVYALGNRYGSELISHAIDFFERLVSSAAPESVISSFSSAPILHLREFSPQPLLVVANNVSISQLRSESGDPWVTIGNMEKTKEGIRAIWQQSNFELKSVLAPSQLSFLAVSSDAPHDWIVSYSLDPWEPPA